MTRLITRPLIPAILLPAALMLGTCGGSSSPPPPPPPPPPANQAPSISSDANVSVAENTSGMIYTVTASDPDGDNVTLSATASADLGAFTFDAATGAVAFVDPPNFEDPDDADGDNVYELAFQADDGTDMSAIFEVRITVTDVDETIAVTRVASGLSQPLLPAALPDGTDRLVVIGKQGEISLLTPASTAPYTVSSFMDISGEVSTSGERGLLGIAFSPDFTTDSTFYVNLTNIAGDTEIRRYQTMSGRLDIGDPATGDIILTVSQPRSNHNAGSIGFDENGLLFIPLGDGGGGGDPDNLAQDPDELLGKVLRIDVTGDDFPADDLRDYAIPPGNTFDGNPSAGRAEIYAIGLRNPYRSSFDPLTGDLIIADVGQNAIEEIDRLPVDDSSRNFGWKEAEGTQAFGSGTVQASFTPPVTEYSHGVGPNEGRSVTGGLVYTGPIDALRNHYIFADFVSDNIWAVPAAALVDGQTLPSSNFMRINDDLMPDQGSINSVTGFGTDMAGDLFIATIGGDVFKVAAD